MDEQEEYERIHEERRYRARRERFACIAFRVMIGKEEPNRRTDWKELAVSAVKAADALEEVLNPVAPSLPPYEA